MEDWRMGGFLDDTLEMIKVGLWNNILYFNGFLTFVNQKRLDYNTYTGQPQFFLWGLALEICLFMFLVLMLFYLKQKRMSKELSD